YGVVVLAIAAGLLNVKVLHTGGPVPTFLLVVIVSAWFGGTRPGLLAIVLSFLLLIHHFLSGGMTPPELLRLFYFLLISSFIVWIMQSEGRAADWLARARDQFQRRNEALTKENVEGKALEDRLRRNESELRLVIDTIPAMAWITHPDGGLEFLNRRWLDYAG